MEITQTLTPLMVDLRQDILDKVYSLRGGAFTS